MFLTILLGFVGPWQIVLVVLIVLLLFGGKKIPELMKGLGKGMKDFKEATKEEPEADKSSDSKVEDADNKK